MVRYIRMDDQLVRDTQTGEVIPVMYRGVWIEDKRKLVYGTTYLNDGTVYFTPTDYLSGICEFHDKLTDFRKVAIVQRHLESGHIQPVVVAVQAAHDSMEYIDCIVPTEP